MSESNRDSIKSISPSKKSNLKPNPKYRPTEISLKSPTEFPFVSIRKLSTNNLNVEKA
jgi:hypothetical protein